MEASKHLSAVPDLSSHTRLLLVRPRIPHGLGPLVEEMLQAVLTYQPDDDDIHKFLAIYIEARFEQRKRLQEGVRSSVQNLEDLLHKKHISHDNADKSALKIQAAFRGYLTRQRLESEGKFLHKTHWKTWEWLRWAWEGPSVLTTEQLKIFLKDENIELDVVNINATRIQSLYRGHAVRRSLIGKEVEEAINKRRNSCKQFHRLSSSLIAIHYDIKIFPRMDTFVFNGSIFVHMLLTIEESSSIMMNAFELTFLSALWKDTSGNEYIAHQIDCDDKNGTVEIHFVSPLPKGYGILHISYLGTMKEDLRGLYIIKQTQWDPESGEMIENHPIAITQFEPTEARKAFPCLDEPDRKATFSISLVVAKGKTSVSNMCLKAVTAAEEEGFEIREYLTTPKMSTYLVAFTIGDFEFLETMASNGVLCRVYTTQGKKEQGRFALQVAIKILPFFAEFFGIPYPLPKLDLVAVPDMPCQAMENWGMIVFRETALLLDATESSQFYRQCVAIVVCHEICHQWFGNLVTMEWWTELWLNEGYATYFETYAADYLFPEFDLWNQFVKNELLSSMHTDAFMNSHPVEVVVNHPADIDAIFDGISYSKGGSIIRMLHLYMGNEAFRKGMHIYLSSHKYGNTITEFLWHALEKASGLAIGKMMDTWTKHVGFPLVRVEFDKANDGTRMLRVAQEKFCAYPISTNDPLVSDHLWSIPLTFSSASKSAVISDCLMVDRSVEVLLPGVRDDEWVKVNPGVTGFYRVQYPSEVLESFIPSIQSHELSPIDRLGLLDDLIALVKCGKNTTVELIHLLSAYRYEKDYILWSRINQILRQLELLLEDTEYYDHFKTYARHLTSLIVKDMGWEPRNGESHSNSMLRGLTLSFVTGSFGDVNAINEARRRMVLHLSGEQEIVPDLRCAIYTAVLSHPVEGEGQHYLEIMKDFYLQADLGEEKERIGQALGALPDPVLLRQVLDFSFSSDVLIGDTAQIVNNVCVGTKQGRRLGWEFIKEKWELFRERYSGGSSLNILTDLLEIAIGHFITEEDATEVEEFFKLNPLAGGERSVAQAVENVRSTAAWVGRDRVKVGEYFATLNLQPA